MRRRSSTAGLLVGVALVLTGGPWSALAIGPPEARPPTLELASMSPWVQPGGTFVVRVTTDAHGPDDRIELSVHERLTSRSSFRRTVSGLDLGGVVASLALPLVDATPDSAGAIVLQVPVRASGVDGDPEAITLAQSGVYPVEVRVVASAGETSLFTHLVLVPDTTPTPRLRVAIVAPVEVDDAIGPDDAPHVDDPAASRLERLASRLSSTPVPVTLAPEPATLDALAAAGAGAALDALRSAASSLAVVTRPYVDLPVNDLVGHQLDGEVSAALAAGAAAVSEHLDVRPPARTWLVDEGLNVDSVSALRELGIDQLVVPERYLVPEDRRLTPARPFEVLGVLGRSQLAVMADSGLTDHLRPRAGVVEAHHFLAELAMLYFDEPAAERGVVVETPARWDPSPEFVDAALGGLNQSPLLQPVSLDALFTEVEPEHDTSGLVAVRELVDDQPLGLGVPAAAVVDHRRSLESFATMVAPDNPHLSAIEHQLLLAQRADLDPPAAEAHLARSVDLLDTELAKVTLPTPGSVTLTAAEADVPITITSAADYPIMVRVTLESERIELPAGGSRDVRLTGPNTTVGFAVRARTAGAFRMEVHLRSPDGVIELATTTVRVRSSAVSGIGIVVSAGALVFLVVWWATHWQRSRRRARAPS